MDDVWSMMDMQNLSRLNHKQRYIITVIGLSDNSDKNFDFLELNVPIIFYYLVSSEIQFVLTSFTFCKTQELSFDLENRLNIFHIICTKLYKNQKNMLFRTEKSDNFHKRGFNSENGK